MTNLSDPFTPDWVSPPGDTILDLLEERDWTQAELAERIGYTRKHISLLVNGKAPITEETALKLTRVLGSTPRFWLNREANYRAYLARKEEEERLESWIDWLDQLPVKALMERGVIPKRRLTAKEKPNLVKELLAFFGVASPEDWNSVYGGMKEHFRRTRSEQSDVGAISGWLRLGEIQAEKLDCPKYHEVTFKKVVKEIRSWTRLKPEQFLPQMQEICLEAGVIFVLVPSIPRARVSGVARWLNPHKALIQLSLYGKMNDRFWFTFFHEVAHILLHSKQDIFLDEWNGSQPIESEAETEANQWARDFLIPKKYQTELRGLDSKEKVKAFAEKISLHPGIVVGRLQHDGLLPKNWMNDLKVKLLDSMTTRENEETSTNYIGEK